mmetsp:Transcript_15587/g.39833  ORF Transcript_15587/g.39833 Transcript_15587/m.39833 type:complete len:212 (-) Transcript_15587:516-1151(-)
MAVIHHVGQPLRVHQRLGGACGVHHRVRHEICGVHHRDSFDRRDPCAHRDVCAPHGRRGRAHRVHLDGARTTLWYGPADPESCLDHVHRDGGANTTDRHLGGHEHDLCRERWTAHANVVDRSSDPTPQRTDEGLWCGRHRDGKSRHHHDVGVSSGRSCPQYPTRIHSLGAARHTCVSWTWVLGWNHLWICVHQTKDLLVVQSAPDLVSTVS